MIVKALVESTGAFCFEKKRRMSMNLVIAEKPSALFDLTNLQREANRRLGYTAQQTLDYTQSMYEKKLVSYPRTDSRYLTEDMEETIPGILEKAQKIVGKEVAGEQNIKSVINGKKVTDHHAIIPTASVDGYDHSCI